MLVLSRQKNEAIVVANGELRIVIVDIRGDKVRLGFEAAKDIPIHRQEIFDAIQRERKAGRQPHGQGTRAERGRPQDSGE